MENKTLNNHSELALHIQQVRKLKESQEVELKVSFKEFTNTLSPVQVLKSGLHALIEDKEVQVDLLTGGLNLSANFIIENVMNTHNIKGFLGAKLLEKVSSSFIQNNAPSILMGITKLFSGGFNQEDDFDEDEDQDEEYDLQEYEMNEE